MENDTGRHEAAAAPPAHDQRAGEGCPVVGIGASAGGLEALQKLLQHLPADTGMAFVVVTHQHPGHTSRLPEILRRASMLPVVEVTHGMPLSPDRVFVAAPGGCLALVGGTLQRMGVGDEASPRSPIDYFLRTLAEDCREHAVCIILSGTGSDGTLGLGAVKSAGGMVMVQDPAGAEYDGMPSSAIATGLADFVLSPAAMPQRLAAYVGGTYVRDVAARAAAVQLPPAALKKILASLRAHTGHDFADYKPNTVGRRIQRRMSVNQIGEAELYARFLQENARENHLLLRDLLISVTRFFRDPPAWQALASSLETLVRGRPADSPVRVWVPACATGEEAYSVAILLHEVLDNLGRRQEVQVFGTDLDARAIDVARRGEYPDGIRADVTPARLERFFTPSGDRYRIRREIRETVIFAPQDAIKDPPFTRLDLICVRNLLIYLNDALQKKLLPLFHYTLRPGALLFLGTSETVGACGELFEPVDRQWKIYRRHEEAGSARAPPLLPGREGPRGAAGARRERTQGTVRDVRLAPQIERVLLRRFAPASVVVNGQGEIFYVHGRTGTYLEAAEGRPRHNVLEMAREGLSAALATALHRCVTEGQEVETGEVPVRTNGARERVRLTVAPLKDPQPVRGLFLVSFEPPPDPPREAAADAGVDRGSLPDGGHGPEEELDDPRGSYGDVLGELETSNEELQSTNEELQSANEELETSQEELHALNEELSTVNAELESKVRELSAANDDMQNLLDNTDIATLFLDTGLNIRRFNEQARALVSLRDTDAGRSVFDLAWKLDNARLEAGCREVLATLVPSESEVPATTGHNYLMRIVPYRTTENAVDGLVLTFVNIDGLTRARRETAFFEAIVQTVRHPMLVLDEDLRIVSANASFCATFGLDREVVEGIRLYEVDGGVWDIPALRRVLEDVLPRQTAFENLEIVVDFADRWRRRFLLNGRRLELTGDGPAMILLALEVATTEDAKGGVK